MSKRVWKGKHQDSSWAIDYRLCYICILFLTFQISCNGHCNISSLILWTKPRIVLPPSYSASPFCNFLKIYFSQLSRLASNLGPSCISLPISCSAGVNHCAQLTCNLFMLVYLVHCSICYLPSLYEVGTLA